MNKSYNNLIVHQILYVFNLKYTQICFKYVIKLIFNAFFLFYLQFFLPIVKQNTDENDVTKPNEAQAETLYIR